MKVMIVVTHLLGTGHLARALTLGRAFAGAGHAVRIVSGGMKVPHLETSGLAFTQLPPLRAEGTDFTNLRDSTGAVATPELRETRIAALLAALTETRPDILITELFPFGRRNLRAEFLALLEAARPLAPLVLGSVRDILAPPSKPAKADWAESVVQEHYHGVLVHADASAIRLQASWPVSPALAPMLHYTGFVAPPLPPASDTSKGEVIVSAGGGNVGTALFRAALEAAGRDTARWRLLVGGDAAATIANLPPPRNAVLEPARRDFRALLQTASASVSLCGYNTAMDILQSGVPGLFVPFDAGGETEQTLRATTLARLPGIACLRASDMTADALLDQLADLRNSPPRETTFSFEGAAESVRIAERLRSGMT